MLCCALLIMRTRQAKEDARLDNGANALQTLSKHDKGNKLSCRKRKVLLLLLFFYFTFGGQEHSVVLSLSRARALSLSLSI
jgi:hypothetical protein